MRPRDVYELDPEEYEASGRTATGGCASTTGRSGVGADMIATVVGTCAAADCDRPVKARGLCNAHYKRWRLTVGSDEVHRHVRTDGTCSVDGCDRPHEARGFCELHYRRWRAHGDPLVVLPTAHGRTSVGFPMTWEVDQSGCWLWTGATGRDGYGHVRVTAAGPARLRGEGPRPTRVTTAHRAAWERFVGPVPDDLDVDHLCGNKGCINPDHLEVVSRSENVRRGGEPIGNPAITVEFLADTAALTRGMKKAEGSSKGLSSRIGGLAKVGGLAAGAAGVGALVATVKIGIGEFAQAQKVTAQTNAVLKSTGGVAKVSAGHVSDLAESLMKKSGVDDEAIASGENLLLTFTNIRNEAGKGNDVFDQTTKAALDMSVALGTDMASASQQLGKALNDPLKGMTKLTKQGVTFTDAQKAQVEAMTKSGDVMGAQKLILGELNKEFGGSAEAAGKTLPGQLAIARESFCNFAGMLVEKVIPYLELAIGWLRDHWPQIVAGLKGAWEAISPVLTSLGDLVVSVVTLIRDNWGTIGPIVEAAVGYIRGALTIIGDIIAVFAALLRGDWSALWEGIKKLVKDVLQQIVNALKLYGAVGGLLMKAAEAVGKAILDGIVSVVKGIPDAVWNLVKLIGAKYVEMYLTILRWGKDLGLWILSGVLSGLAGIAGDAWDKIKAIGTRIDGLIDTVKGWGKDVGRWILQGVASGLAATADWLEKKVKEAFGAVIGWAKEALGISSPSTEFAKIGKWLIEGLIKGVGGMGSALKDAVIDLAKSVPGKIFGKLNPFGGGGKKGSPLDTLLAFAGQLGMGVSSTTGGKHTPTSMHYQGRAIDVVGSASQMERFFAAAVATFGTAIKELFYDPIGWYVKNGAGCSARSAATGRTSTWRSAPAASSPARPGR